jgi:hypothetical protein
MTSPRDDADAPRASLASFGCAWALFAVLAVAVWAQLTIGWQWAKPQSAGTASAVIVMSAVMALFLVLTVLGAAPIVWIALTRIVRRQSPATARWSLMFLAGSALLVIGSRHFGNGWPGTGGHAWAHQGLVPGGVAAFTWAATLSVTSYWAHPGALIHFPITEVAWMAVSPVAMVCVVAGATKTFRRVALSDRLLGYERFLGRLCEMGMVVFLGAMCSWLFGGDPGPKNLFHFGAIDVGALIVMALALGAAHQAGHHSRHIGHHVLTP